MRKFLSQISLVFFLLGFLLFPAYAEQMEIMVLPVGEILPYNYDGFDFEVKDKSLVRPGQDGVYLIRPGTSLVRATSNEGSLEFVIKVVPKDQYREEDEGNRNSYGNNSYYDHGKNNNGSDCSQNNNNDCGYGNNDNGCSQYNDCDYGNNDNECSQYNDRGYDEDRYNNNDDYDNDCSGNTCGASRSSNGSGNQASLGDVSPQATNMLAKVNAERAKAGLRPLSLDPVLMRGANVRAKELKTYYSHTRPDGSSCFTSIPEYFNKRAVAENIAVGQADTAEVMRDWMNSPGHRENILNPNYKYLGVGYYYDKNSSYKKHWVQLFAGN